MKSASSETLGEQFTPMHMFLKLKDCEFFDIKDNTYRHCYRTINISWHPLEVQHIACLQGRHLEDSSSLISII